jgi:hypothetical protein
LPMWEILLKSSVTKYPWMAQCSDFFEPSPVFLYYVENNIQISGFQFKIRFCI